MTYNYYHYTQLDNVIANYGYIPIKLYRIQDNNKKWYNHIDIPLTYDTETTTLFRIGGKWGVYDYDKDIKNGGTYDYIHAECHTVVYLWTFTMWFGYMQWTFYGRSNKEFKIFIDTLRNKILSQCGLNDCRMIIYVHNLAFDFTNSLQNIYAFNKVFARKPHKPIYAVTNDDNIEFRCSYFLSNSSLDNITRDNVFFKKLTGSIDYMQLRLPHMCIDDDVIKYACYDTMSLAEYIAREQKEYKHIKNIPLTSTGKLRLYVKGLLSDKPCVKRDSKCIPTVKEYLIALATFQGGDTHASVLYANTIISDVRSKDISSSYPYVEISEKFPDSRFVSEYPDKFNQYIDSEEHCVVVNVTFRDIISTCVIPYIKANKVISVDNARYDNGRIWKCSSVTMWLTDIDFKLILSHYNVKGGYVINDMYIAHKSYLTYDEIKLVLTLYENKTRLKGIAEEEENYKRSKNYINADFGRNVCKLIQDDVEYCNGEYSVIKPTQLEIEDKLKKLANKPQFTNYWRGVYITAYARRNLYRGIDIMGTNHIYNDTDSVKGLITPDIDCKFNELNNWIIDDLQRKLPPDLFAMTHPKDKFGVEHQIGIFCDDEEYKKFITYGSKKYGGEDKDGNVHLTVSGLKKTAGKTLKSIEDFKLGMVFNTKTSGRSYAYYQDNQPPLIYDNHVYDDKYSLSIIPDTYTLSITKEYSDLINYSQHSR